jgi:uncharacterized protein (TIGR03435 family)
MQMMIPIPIEGGPAWINSDSYLINAKAEGTPNPEMMMGPMMQVLLEDRFKLKIRRETREVPVYALTVAKAGPKLQRVKGSCAPFSAPRPLKPDQADCGPQGVGRKGPNMTWGFIGDADEFSKILFSWTDRPVVNKTGITGLSNFHLEFAPDETTRGFGVPGGTLPDDPSGGTSIFTAVQEQLGLKLEPTRGPGERLVIDHLERPSQN